MFLISLTQKSELERTAEMTKPSLFTDVETEAPEVRELVRGRAGFPRDRHGFPY